MNILVTGGAGFIGTTYIKYWHANHPEDHITNLDSLTYAGKRENLAELEGSDRYTFVQGSITDAPLVQRLMQGIDVVVHYAAETHVDRSISGPSVFVDTNVVGTHILLEAARQAGVKRFHHVSTDEVFGTLSADGNDTFSEATPYDPRSPYSASKAASDHLVRAYFHTYGLPITISNCTNNYGPYQFPEKLIPVMVLKAMRGEQLPLYGDGSNVRDWIHVEDHARGVEAILANGVPGETYCLGGDAERSNKQIATAILKLLNKPESQITYVTDRPGHDQRYAMDCTKAKQQLGWQRKYSFETGLAETVAWYAERADQLSPDEQGVHATT